MRILSFDVGIINLAYCIFDSTTSKITHWGIIDLCDRKSESNKVKFSATVPSGNKSIAKAANDIHITLIKSLDNLAFLLEVDYVVIEKQPSFNPKMRIIGGCLQSYFYIRGIVDKNVDKITSIEFFSPKHKLKCYTGPELTLDSNVKSKYAQTKKMGILIARSKLNELNETSDFKQLFETSKKKDDLADCYLQAITFCLFKKFKSSQNECVLQTENETFSLLNKTQIKKRLKEYLDKHTVILSVNELLNKLEGNQERLKKVLESMDPQLKQSIIAKFGKDFENMDFLDQLSMKSYKSKWFNLPDQVN